MRSGLEKFGGKTEYGAMPVAIGPIKNQTMCHPFPVVYEYVCCLKLDVMSTTFING